MVPAVPTLRTLPFSGVPAILEYGEILVAQWEDVTVRAFDEVADLFRDQLHGWGGQEDALDVYCEGDDLVIGLLTQDAVAMEFGALAKNEDGNTVALPAGAAVTGALASGRVKAEAMLDDALNFSGLL